MTEGREQFGAGCRGRVVPGVWGHLTGKPEEPRPQPTQAAAQGSIFSRGVCWASCPAPGIQLPPCKKLSGFSHPVSPGSIQTALGQVSKSPIPRGQLSAVGSERPTLNRDGACVGSHPHSLSSCPTQQALCHKPPEVSCGCLGEVRAFSLYSCKFLSSDPSPDFSLVLQPLQRADSSGKVRVTC